METKHYKTIEEYYKVHLRHESEELKGEDVVKKAKKNENKTKAK